MKSNAKDNTITLTANAKVNLALSVIGTKNNGLHSLDTVIARVRLSDIITITKRRDSLVTASYTSCATFPKDTAIAMAELIIKRYNLCGVDISIDKKIPIGCGIGGSSADAVGVAQCMRKLFALDGISSDILTAIGDDVCVMYNNSAVARKTGDTLTKVTNADNLLFILLYYNNISVSTKEVFAEYDRSGGENCDIDAFLQRDFASPTNALERSAIRLYPQLAELKSLLQYSGIANVVMTGSGGGFIGYTTNATQYQQAIDYINKHLKNNQMKMEIF